MPPFDPQSSHSWMFQALAGFVLFLTGGTFATLVTLYVYRKRTAAETEKIEAETQHIAFVDEVSAAQLMRESLRDLSHAQKTIGELTTKAARSDAQTIEIEMLNQQLDRYISTETQVQRLKDGTTSGEHLR